jgi:hypothetical protein
MFMRDSGQTINLVAREGWFMQMVMFTKANGLMTRQMAGENIFTTMEHNMLDNGKMTNSME